jgi:hypothetical protein
MLVGDFGEREQTASGAAREYDSFHIGQDIGYCLHGNV